ncbi:hypothetical protein G3I01_03020 [Gramella sp. MT6]|uniref:hypothetical protein n=1 Tax=Gramella sp. MT6 TaxID=2705471 RepID=UPI001C5DD5D1|nr:hypothetical protein [Gramella sp. MT6]QYA24521.1 hypothetical protein G3I01_03020 [Gramella sp. MT6]
MPTAEKKPIYRKSLISCLLILVFGIYLTTRGTKEKTEFESITGPIDYFDETFQEITYGGKGDHRFIHVAGAPVVFELFVGKATGDFSPKFENLDALRPGDEITVYYADKTPFQKNVDLRLNKTVQFIDKDGEAYFIRGNKDKYGGYSAIGFSILMSGGLFILKKTGKII